ncbi:hypothetical protein RGQ21_02480 [Kitasatospora aureofaciens]|nr:hypothetical protein RGQ21_02480 [Kitasatospora aureofaciens]
MPAEVAAHDHRGIERQLSVADADVDADVPVSKAGGADERTGSAADLGTEDRADHRTGGGPDTTRIPSPRTR